MAATFAGNPENFTCEKTVEPAEEVNMEAVNVTTEQPHPGPSPVQDRIGEGHVKSEVKAIGVSSSDGQDKDLGSSVDDIPLIDLSTSSKESLNVEGQGQSVSKHSDASGSPKDNDQISEGDVTSESEVSVGIESVNEEPSTETGDGNRVDRLAKLAKQIDDFDPSPIFEKKVVPGGVEYTGDINDDKLVDKLLNDSADDEQISKINVDKDDKGKGEITPCEAEEVGDESKEDSPGDDTDEGDIDENSTNAISNVETPENSEESQQNGDMSASTESEGFQEEKANGENNNPEKPTAAIEENKATQNKQDTQKAETTSPTKTAKSKKKEDKSIEHILKALSSLQTTEEKLAALCKKYADLHEEHRVLQSSYKQNQRKLTVTTREKDQLQAEHTKAVMAKSKLESLCRELQKHNQTIRQESLQRAKEEDEKRKEISQKFQTTIGEIQTQMQENHERNKQLREENFELANKLKKFIEQYEAREKQVEKVIQHRELEQKLADAKLEQASAILMEEKGRSQKEKELLILQSTEYMKKMQLKEAELNMYKERYEEFQSTIKKSEEMFSKFKVEMDKMTKRCKKMEKDGAQWKGKWENANRALLEMAEEKTKYDKERSLLMTKIGKLESLCRAMQAERQARKMLDTTENGGTGVQPETDMAKLGIDTTEDDMQSSLPPLPSDPFPFRTSPVNTGSTPASEERVADSTTGGDNAEDGAENTCGENGPSEGDSDNSCASEQTGVTVIQQTPAVQSEDSSGTNNQSESQIQEITSSDQSGTSLPQNDQMQNDQSNTAS
ncbi:alpha-taxilin-like isoform X3 [Mercenaria mercenaria]|uniref:alpha-taxilin-like isoform X3 n=1 Tax=Mercenaria mercenaria TaxID=6596 RepID=UPI00234EAF5C|nr:alpha-taxilin-like isoform X3 [Mercenaria mercenaria]